MTKNNIKKVHFIGIGGIGMSSLAFFLRGKGIDVSGSDIGTEQIIKKLKKNGCKITNTHKGANINNHDLVIYSSAIKKNNPEIIEAKKKNIKILKRGEALGFFTKSMKNITITGCHGKSTTSSISHFIINNSKISLTGFIGAEDKILKSNFYQGKSKYCLIEGDESDNSFNNINSHISLITNIDDDHLDFYGSKKRLLLAFKEFILNTKYKCLVNVDSPMLKDLIESISSKKIIKFSQKISDNTDYSFQILKNKYTTVELFKKNKSLGIFKSKLLGEFNAYNLVASIILALELGIKIQGIKELSQKCKAPKRRFETIISNKKIKIIDDYAHHPTAIKAIRENINKNFAKDNIILIFQPHRFSRTKILLNDFIKELSLWNRLYLVDIYSAFERQQTDILDLFKEIKKINPNALYFKNKKTLINKILSKSRDKKYTILTMGAGDIRDVGIKLKKTI
tara:strand:- start:2 stop:1363 length:1362 start_codon:yes stop_codon:yes gene_type:complete